jgi:hypothetical protein
MNNNGKLGRSIVVNGVERFSVGIGNYGRKDP